MTKEELQIVNAGKASGKTPQEVASAIAKYRGGAQPGAQQVAQPPASNQYSFGEAFGDVKEGVKGAYQSMKTAGQSIVNRGNTFDTNIGTGENIARNVVGAGADLFKGIAGVVGNVFGTGAKLAVPQGVENKVAEVAGSAMQAVADTDIAKKIYAEYQSLPFEQKLAVDNSLSYLEGIITLMTAGQAKNAGRYIVSKLKKGEPTVNNAVQAVTDVARSAGMNGRKDIATSIMQRVARIDPTKEIEFERMTGKKVGEFLAERGEYHSPEKIIKNLYEESERSYKQVDAEFEKITNTYRPPVFDDMLPEMLAREQRVSATGAPSRDLATVTKYAGKWEGGEGLTMKEINELKRVYQRTVKLGYAKDKNTDMTERATNIDNALRKWQIEEAKKEGFLNLDEINKNTQATRFLADQLWRKEAKMSANNALGLTEAVLLSGGNLNAVTMALTRRFIGSKTVQAKIAKMLGGEATAEKVVPKIGEKQTTSPQTMSESPSQLPQELSPLPTTVPQPPKQASSLSTGRPEEINKIKESIAFR